MLFDSKFLKSIVSISVYTGRFAQQRLLIMLNAFDVVQRPSRLLEVNGINLFSQLRPLIANKWPEY